MLIIADSSDILALLLRKKNHNWDVFIVSNETIPIANLDSSTEKKTPVVSSRVSEEKFEMSIWTQKFVLLSTLIL